MLTDVGGVVPIIYRLEKPSSSSSPPTATVLCHCRGDDDAAAAAASLSLSPGCAIASFVLGSLLPPEELLFHFRGGGGILGCSRGGGRKNLPLENESRVIDFQPWILRAGRSLIFNADLMDLDYPRVCENIQLTVLYKDKKNNDRNQDKFLSLSNLRLTIKKILISQKTIIRV